MELKHINRQAGAKSCIRFIMAIILKSKKAYFMQTRELIQNIAQDLNLSYDAFLNESVKVFLEKRLKDIRLQIYNIGLKYNITSVEELDNLYKEGKVEELESFSDYTELDRLEYQKDKIERLMEQLSE